MSLKDYLSLEEAARLKGVSRQALYLAEKEGRLKIERIGRCALVNKVELEKYQPNPGKMRAGSASRRKKAPSKSLKTTAKKRVP